METNKILNTDFIAEAEKRITFTLDTKHFTKLDFKHEIQFLFTKYWFPEFNGFIDGPITLESIQTSIKTLRSINQENYIRLFDYAPKGVGQGELLLYYVFNNATLGGGSSGGVDVICNGLKYEVKAIKATIGKANTLGTNGYTGLFFKDIKIGSTMNINPVVSALFKLAKETGIDVKDENSLSNGQIVKIRETRPDEYEQIQDDYRRIVGGYFNSHDMIIFSNDTVKSGPAKFGDALHVGNFAKDDIYIDRYTAGTIKPLIKVD